jgi:L-amino acid N-acyltransferase YncA/rRNA-processing protein FCF1/predicted transcriptional regulator
MKILLDTNILIPIEPASVLDTEAQSPQAIVFINLAHQGKHDLVVHPATYMDLSKDKDADRAALRKRLLAKYSQLEKAPENLGDERYGNPAKGTNDWIDNQLLFAIERKAVDLLVTEDQRLHRKAERIGIGESVYYLHEVISSLQVLVERRPAPPPAIEEVIGYNLDEKDPIWDSLRKDYPGFDSWLDEKVKKKGRKAYVIKVNDSYAGICILKEKEVEIEFGFGPETLKICTFKVSDEFRGNLFGELFLKAVFNFCSENRVQNIFVSIFEKHQELVSLFERFGFEQTSFKGAYGDQIYLKKLKPSPEDLKELAPFDFHKKYGPWITKFTFNKTYVVPIQGHYHKLLFPDHPLEHPELFSGGFSFGNSIGKIYVSTSKIKKLKKGDNLLFYHSEEVGGITAMGIVENVLRTSAADLLYNFVFKRTVYSEAEIREFCRGREALAIKFRQVRLFDKPIEFIDLMKHGVLSGAPQSIQEVREDGVTWLENRVQFWR